MEQAIFGLAGFVIFGVILIYACIGIVGLIGFAVQLIIGGCRWLRSRARAR